MLVLFKDPCGFIGVIIILVVWSEMRKILKGLLSWSLISQEFDLSIKYVKSIDNVLVDCLSRC